MFGIGFWYNTAAEEKFYKVKKKSLASLTTLSSMLTIMHMHLKCFVKWNNDSSHNKDLKQKKVCIYGLKIYQRTNTEADTMQPKWSEIAMVYHTSDDSPAISKNICICPLGNQLCRINSLNPNCEPMNYVSFFLHG